MQPQSSDNRIRPLFAAILIGALAAILIPVWMLTRSGPDVTASLPAPATPAAKPRPERVTPDNWRRVTPPPRGAAVSIRSLTMPKPVTTSPTPGIVRPPPRIGTPRILHAGRGACVAPVVTTTPTVEDRWGIRLCGARFSMGNVFLDVRYEIVDPAKASRLASGKTPAYLLDCSTGTRLPMVAPPREGAFPPTGNRLATGTTYFATIGNKGAVLKSGGTVRIVVGDAASTNLTID